MLDRARVMSKLDELEGHLRDLVTLAPSTPEAYRADLGRRLACERLLQLGVECLIDLGEIFVASLRLGLPSDEAGVFRRLGEHGVLAAEDVALLQSMQGFRNILVHQYGKLDHAKAFANLRRAPSDFRRLARAFRDAADRLAGK